MRGELLSKDERKNIMEWLAEMQRHYPMVIRVPACHMYTLVLRERRIEPKHFPMDLVRRIPYYGRGCAAGMPSGYITILPNSDVIPCMLLQVRTGNARGDDIKDLWQNSPILKTLRSRNLLKGACGTCKDRDACAGCRGRAYQETRDILHPWKSDWGSTPKLE